MSHTDKHLTEKIHYLGKHQQAFWTFVSLYGIYVFIFFFAGVWIGSGLAPSLVGELCLAVLVTLACTFAIRYLVRRPRPDFLHTRYVPVLKKFSFPSAHASSSFSLATTIALLELSGGVTAVGLSASIALFATAILISVSRIMVGVHFLTDVLAGAFLGSLVSFVVFLLL